MVVSCTFQSILLSTFYTNIPNLCYSLWMTNQVQHMQNTMGTHTVLYISLSIRHIYVAYFDMLNRKHKQRLTTIACSHLAKS